MKQAIKHTRFAEVCQLIDARMGLHFPVERWDMVGRNLSQAAGAFGFDRFDEFIEWLLTAELDQNQIKILATFLTISETYFWREPPVFEALMNFMLPDIIQSKKEGNKNIRIWSAGCSTGEEPYSLAMAIHQAIPHLHEWKIQILATDMNPKALEKAEQGIYTQWSFRNCPPWLKNKYFQDLGEGKFKIIPLIRNMVTFSNLNLAHDNFPDPANHTHAIDILFCRNVLMYFSDEWVNQISKKLYHSLQQDGWFVVSSCELSSQRFPQFKAVNFPGAVIYRKGSHEFQSTLNISSFDFKNNVIRPDFSDKKLTKKADRLEGIPDLEAFVFTYFVSPDSNERHLITEMIEHPVDIPNAFIEKDIALQIRLLANQGNLIEALALCEEGIKEDKLAIALYFLRASILQEQEKTGEAIASLKQAIYLDHNFIMGHFALGNLYLRQAKLTNAKRHFTNALDSLSACLEDDILPDSEGLSVKYIREIILANMENRLL